MASRYEGKEHQRRNMRKMLGSVGPGPGSHFCGPRGEGRMRRGDVKYVLLAALQHCPMHGYDIMHALEERFQGRYRPSPGSVYPTLQMLEEGGFLASEIVDGKRVYTITDEGRRLLEERGVVEDHDSTAAAEWGDLRDSARKLVIALRQAVPHADPQAREHLRKVIDDARRAIYQILAAEE